jgi:hypothetical protein
VDTNSETSRTEEKVLWHITLALTYEGGVNDTCQDGVEKIRKALSPLIANGSGIKQMFFTSLPEKG